MKATNNPRIDVFKSDLVKDADFVGQYEFACIRKSDHIPQKAVPFDKSVKITDRNQWVHFYIHDYQFERLWKQPNLYLSRLISFNGVITPDFSVCREMPLAMQIWNTYRNRAIGHWLQSNEIPIIPNVRWGDERTYSYAFDGIEPGGTISVSTCGCIHNKQDRYYFIKGLEKMVEVLNPPVIVNYSQTPDDIFAKYKKAGIIVVELEYYRYTNHKRNG